MKTQRLIPFLVLITALAACAPREAEVLPAPARPTATAAAKVLPPDPSATAPLRVEIPTATPGEVLAAPGQLAVRELADRLDVDPAKIEVLSVEPVEWPDSSLGCPEPGKSYAQVITPGYWLALRAEGTIYFYHTDQGELVVLCPGGLERRLPPIPILPGEKIWDGEPWMPVEPVPTVQGLGEDRVDPVPLK